MSTKNNPLRIIDQTVPGLTANPSAAKTKFNPYTGSVIKTSEAANYGVWIRASGAGTVRTIPVEISASDTRIVFIRITIPNIILSLTNPNYTLERIKFFFTFTRNQFDNYLDVEYFTGSDALLNKIVTVDSTSVLSLANTSGQGSMEISAHIARLFTKYTLADLVLLTGAVSSVEGLTSEDLLRIFIANTSSLTLFCQVGFQDLLPTNSGKRTPYVKRTNATIQFQFSDERLTEDTVSDVKLYLENTGKFITFTKTFLKSLEYTVYDRNNANQVVHRGTVGALESSNDQVISQIIYPASITNFNWVNALRGNEQQILQNLQKYSSNLALSVDRVVTSRNVSYTGNALLSRYGLEQIYIADTTREQFVKPTLRSVIKYDFTTNRRIFVVEPNGSTADVVGFAIVYTRPSVDGGISYPAVIHYVPARTITINGRVQFLIEDSFNDPVLGNTALPLQRITVYTLLKNAHFGNVVTQVNSPAKIRLQKFIANETPDRGYFLETIRLSSDRNSIVFNEFGKRDNQLEAVVNFNLVVQRNVNNVWTTLTNGIIQCIMRYNPSYTGVLVLNAQNQQIASVSIAQLTSARGTYRVLAQPRFASNAYAGLYENTTSLTTIQFTR